MTDRPALAWEHATLHTAAQRMLASAEAAAPRLVGEGKLDADEAQRGLRILRAIKAEWLRASALLAGAPITARSEGASRFEKELFLLASLKKARDRFDRARTALMPALPMDMLAEMRGSGLALDRLQGLSPHKYPEAPVFLAAEQHYREVEALHWHAQRLLGVEDCAEITRELRDRNPQAIAA